MTITLEGKSVDIDVSGSFRSMSLDEQIKHYVKPALSALNERINADDKEK